MTKDEVCNRGFQPARPLCLGLSTDRRKEARHGAGIMESDDKTNGINYKEKEGKEGPGAEMHDDGTN